MSRETGTNRFGKSLNRFFVLSVVAVSSFFSSAELGAQERAGGEKRSRFMDRLNSSEAGEMLEMFRRQRLAGDYCFHFSLEHKPRRSRGKSYEGFVWGSWNDAGPVSRFLVSQSSASPARSSAVGPPAIDILVRSGRSAEAYRFEQGQPFPITDERLYQPLFGGIEFSAFDLQMPFIFWKAYNYVGPTNVGATRVAQQFDMLPPENFDPSVSGISKVRIGLDSDFNALWRVEVYNTEASLASKFSVESVKKVDGQYIVKTITLKNEETGDRTTFRVKGAAVNQKFPANLFDSEEVVDPRRFIPNELKRI